MLKTVFDATPALWERVRQTSPLPPHISEAAAFFAGVVYYLAPAAAFRAVRLRLHNAEHRLPLGDDRAGAPAVGTGLRRGAGRAARAAAVRAGLNSVEGYLLVAAESGLLKGYGYVLTDALALHRGVARAG